MTEPARCLTLGNAIAALAVLAGVALVLLRSESPEEAAAPDARSASLLLLELQTKLLSGVARFDRAQALAELEKLGPSGKSAESNQALAAFEAYVRPPESRREALRRLPPPAEWDPLDRTVARAIVDPGRLSAAERAALLAEMGWFGRLLLAASDEACAREVASSSLKAMTIASLASVSLFVATGVGLVLLVVAIARRARGGLPFRLQPAPQRAHLYFQSFAIYLWGMILLSSAASLASLGPPLSLAASACAIFLSLGLGVSYPLLRGVKASDWRADLGLHRGRGFLREITAGLAAYLAMLPVLALGLALTLALQRLSAGGPGETSSPVSHPIYGLIPNASPVTLALLFLVAAVLGPFVEETMFRGALYGSLRGFAGRALSLLLMSFLFAAVHPQGLIAIPSLMGIAISFGIMREWRSSLIAGAVMHGLHNGTLLLGILALLA